MVGWIGPRQLKFSAYESLKNSRRCTIFQISLPHQILRELAELFDEVSPLAVVYGELVNRLEQE